MVNWGDLVCYLFSSLVRFQKQRPALKSLLYYVFLHKLVRMLNIVTYKGVVHTRIYHEC